MIKHVYIFIFLLLVYGTGMLYPQLRFRMLGGDRLKKLEDGRYFIDKNVHLSYGFYGIKCDSAFMDSTYERAWLYGNIVLWDTLRTIKCKQADIYKVEESSKAYLHHDVEIDQDSIKIYGDEARFYQQFQNTIVEGAVKVKYTTSPSLLQSEYLKYDMEKGVIEARRVTSVQFVDSVYKLKMFTDQVYYNTTKNILKLEAPFRMLMTELARKIPNIDSIKHHSLDSLLMIPDKVKGSKTTIKATKGIYNIEDGLLNLYRNCNITMIDSVGEKTDLKADTIFYHIEQELIELHGNVSFAKDTLNGTCGYAEFQLEKNILKLFEKPVMHMGQDFAKGETITITFNKESTYPSRITLTDNALMESISDQTHPEEKNSIKGKLMEMYFADKELEKIMVAGEATSVYFIKDNKKKNSAATASNFITGDTLNVTFKEGNVESINIKGGSQGTYYPGKLKQKALK